MLKVINIVGARPQFIKYFPVSKAIAKTNDSQENMVKDVLVHTGQHYDYSMSKVFFDDLGIKEPDYHLEAGSGSHGEQTGQVLQKVEEILLSEKPDAILVYGDTNSTLGGALAASKLHIPIAHVEAGLRSFNKNMPEEINRILTDHVSSLLLCPSRTAVNNLQREGFPGVLNEGMLIPDDYFCIKGNKFRANADTPLIVNTGDVMHDVLLRAAEIAETKSDILNQLKVESGEYVLLTIHRAENTDNQDKFNKLISFINDLTKGKTVIFPAHPRTANVYKKSTVKLDSNVRIVDPLGYFDLVKLLQNASLAMTDSGGMQKEAYWLKTPCITLRDETEWVETVESGWNILYKNFKEARTPSGRNENYYGDGKAAKKIVDTLINSI